MKSYKILQNNMKDFDGNLYEIGKTYQLDVHSNVYKNGFQSFSNIMSIFNFYEIDDIRIFVADVKNPKRRMLTKYGNLLSSEMTILGEVNYQDYNYNKNFYYKNLNIVKNYLPNNINELFLNKDWKSRIIAVNLGSDIILDKLIKDKSIHVRAEIAKYGRDKDLNILVYDKAPLVRFNVMKHGREKDLKILINDEDETLKIKALEKYKNINKENKERNIISYEILDENNNDIFTGFPYDFRKKYIIDNKRKINGNQFLGLLNLDDVIKIVNSHQFKICEAKITGNIKIKNDFIFGNEIEILGEINYSMFNSGENYYYKKIDILKNENTKYLKEFLFSSKENKDIIIYNSSNKILDYIFANINNYDVRATIANYGLDKYLDSLVFDDSYIVRTVVAKQGRDKDLDILVHDENGIVRQNVAKQGRCIDLDYLVNDKDDFVRMEVAKQGRLINLFKLIFDKNKKVKSIAREKMKQQLNIIFNKKKRKSINDFLEKRYFFK